MRGSFLPFGVLVDASTGLVSGIAYSAYDGLLSLSGSTAVSFDIDSADNVTGIAHTIYATDGTLNETPDFTGSLSRSHALAWERIRQLDH
ncbi:MAG: hypothetical protein PVI97_18990 [Candidatus Thiodiazotropha sp.]|jgi:uncharacterized protein RhaS with RHS repeats